MKGSMQPMIRASGLAFSLAAALVVSACSETAMQDLLGNGKSDAPDSSGITVGQNLAMPPDLQLRAPPDGPSSDTQANAQPPVEPASTAAAQPLPQPQGTTQTASAEAPKQDAYERYGISKTYPDGK